MAKKDELIELCTPVVEGLGYEFWGIEYIAQGKHSTLRVFIESEKGITVDDCSAVSRQISAVMDVEDPIAAEYTLEVSSPGLDRPLFSAKQFEAYLNNMVAIRLSTPFEGRRKFKGQLLSVVSDEVAIYVDGHEIILPLEMIDQANVVPTFED